MVVEVFERDTGATTYRAEEIRREERARHEMLLAQGVEALGLQDRVPHGLVADASGALYVTDSEAHRIRLLK